MMLRKPTTRVLNPSIPILVRDMNRPFVDDVDVETIHLAELNLVHDEDRVQLMDLPEEVLVHILSFLSICELYGNVALVSKLFYRLTRDPSVRVNIYFGPKVEPPFAKEFLADSPLARKLVLKNRSDADILVQTALENCPHLKHLEAKFCHPITNPVVKILSESRILPQLESFSLEGTSVSISLVQDEWCNIFAKMRNLRNLNLFSCRLLTDEDICNIGTVCTHLTFLNLEEVTNLKTDPLVRLILDRKDTLKTLLLDGEYMNDDVFGLLGKCQKLENLSMAFAESIATQGMEAISNLSNLKTLRLTRAKELPPIEFATTFSSPKLSQLTKLNLSECSLLDDASLRAVALTCRQLKELLLNWCWELTDDGVDEVILYCDQLEALSLMGVVRITEAVLIDVGIHLPDLVYLNLEQCPNVNDSTVTNMVRTGRPDFQVVNYWGETLVRCTTNPLFPMYDMRAGFSVQ